MKKRKGKDEISGTEKRGQCMNELDQLPEIKAQELLPFEKRPRCRKCEAKLMNFFACFLFNDGWRVFPMEYCPGGKPPAEDRAHFVFQVKVENICAGVTKEHMHRQCPRCGHRWLSEVGHG